jgi:hypothetical protein
MIRTNNDEESMRGSLDEVVDLFEQAQSDVFKLMASVSLTESPDVFLANLAGFCTQIPSRAQACGRPSRSRDRLDWL